MKNRPTTTDAYLAALPTSAREALIQIRNTIRSAEPGMEERISSGAPFFWHGRHRAVGFGAAKTHLSFYIMHGDVLDRLREELIGFDVSRTVIRFSPDKPLPPALIRMLVQARIQEIDVRSTRPIGQSRDN